MLQVIIIESVEQYEWSSSMVIQENKKGGIKISIDIRKLNNACIIDPFPTLVIDEVLESVGGQESYSIIDEFLGYHHITISKEDYHYTTLSTEYRSYQYTAMPFGLKNA